MRCILIFLGLLLFSSCSTSKTTTLLHQDKNFQLSFLDSADVSYSFNKINADLKGYHKKLFEQDYANPNHFVTSFNERLESSIISILNPIKKNEYKTSYKIIIDSLHVGGHSGSYTTYVNNLPSTTYYDKIYLTSVISIVDSNGSVVYKFTSSESGETNKSNFHELSKKLIEKISKTLIQDEGYKAVKTEHKHLGPAIYLNGKLGTTTGGYILETVDDLLGASNQSMGIGVALYTHKYLGYEAEYNFLGAFSINPEDFDAFHYYDYKKFRAGITVPVRLLVTFLEFGGGLSYGSYRYHDEYLSQLSSLKEQRYSSFKSNGIGYYVKGSWILMAKQFLFFRWNLQYDYISFPHNDIREDIQEFQFIDVDVGYHF